MLYEEAVAILNLFDAENPNLTPLAGPAFGIRLVQDESPRIEVLVEPSRPGKAAPKVDLPTKFTLRLGGQELTLPVRAVFQERYRALPLNPVVQPPRGDQPPAAVAAPAVQIGDTVFGFLARADGTVGWNLYLDGALSFLTCWHVVCPLSADPPKGEYISFDYLPCAAKLTDASRVLMNDQAKTNYWDLAIGEYVDASTVSNQISACDPCPPPPYPTQFAANPNSGDRVLKIGAIDPRCNTSSISNPCYCGWVEYHHNGSTDSAYFCGQLEMPIFTDHGDSGALAIDTATNEIVGVCFAISNSGKSLANPLFTIGWKYRCLHTGDNLPMYESNGQLFPPLMPRSHAARRRQALRRLRRARLLID